MSNRIILTSAMRSTLLSLQQKENLIEATTRKLATREKVGSALDNPQNFFAALGLSSRATDLNRRIDGMGQSLKTIEEAMHGLEAISKLLDQAEAIVTESKIFAENGEGRRELRLSLRRCRE